MKYILDANVFIQAKNFHYGFDFCPGFWDWLRKSNEAERVYSPSSVRDELLRGNDELSDWVKTCPVQFFSSPTKAHLEVVQEISVYVESKYIPRGARQFLSGADPFLIAHGKVDGWTVITHEIGSPMSTTKVKIPDVCKEFGVAVMPLIEVFRREKVRLVLD